MLYCANDQVFGTLRRTRRQTIQEVTRVGDIPLTLQLHITNACNLKCRYCYEINKGSRYMPAEVAKKAISKYMLREDDFDQVVIDLIGGEPMLAFDLVQELTEFAEQEEKNWTKNYQIMASTNGTLLNEDRKQWLFEHRDKVVLCPSFDGMKKAHDYNRSNSYDEVVRNIPFFKETWPCQPVKMTINADVVDQIYEGILNIYSMGLTCFANMVFEDVWGSPEEKARTLAIFEEQLERLVQYFSEHVELTPPSTINLPIELFVTEKDRYRRWCGSGRSMVAFDFEGREFPCHRYISTSTTRPFQPEMVTSLDDVVWPCYDCPFFFACQSCEGYNWEVNGHPFHNTTYHCEFIKLQVLATAKLKYNRLPYRLNLLPEMGDHSEFLGGLRATVESILYVQQHGNLTLPGETVESLAERLKEYPQPAADKKPVDPFCPTV